MKFTKMQGIGNDYVYVDCFQETVADPEKTARLVSDRHFGIGSDGLILVCPSNVAQVRMDMYNGDGSRGKMCGNGLRCVAKFAYEHGYAAQEEFEIETLAGNRHVKLEVTDGHVDFVTADMGEARITSEVPEKIAIGERQEEFIGVDIGNPHAVYYVSSEKALQALDLEKWGPLYENHLRFPDQVNSEFVYIISPERLQMRVWERGSGETLACGTGACAAFYATMKKGLCRERVTMELLGGELQIFLQEGRIYMRCPAVTVFTGEIDLETL